MDNYCEVLKLALAGVNAPSRFEIVLSRLVRNALEAHHIDYRAEVRLSEHDRLDFFIPSPGVAIEIKVKGSLSALLRQIHRYAAHEEIKEIVVVTNQRRLLKLPGEMGDFQGGKKIPVNAIWAGVF